ncbi:hypothetical protein [Photobacterium atrarenae]|uniref:Uncharacterized protein n=1 Tax=Photobacterium atrarenae TaxID=865757 RepID=A0ABY5GEA6_9GAMM|nr:hypothetical protein [Photobacterium atrarenae]UTV27516.1 hypothetical protein NNL38_14565 [Photobacterium atrarenae]
MEHYETIDHLTKALILLNKNNKTWELYSLFTFWVIMFQKLHKLIFTYESKDYNLPSLHKNQRHSFSLILGIKGEQNSASFRPTRETGMS